MKVPFPQGGKAVVKDEDVMVLEHRPSQVDPARLAVREPAPGLAKAVLEARREAFEEAA